MPRYIVERTFVDGLDIPTTSDGATTCLEVVHNNAEERVTWVTSYVTPDNAKTFCVYDGPDEQAIERAAVANGLPIDGISEVRVLDPYFYTQGRPSTR